MQNKPKVNYQKELEKVLCTLENKTPRLFLHACCAPCSSYVLEYLANYFQITIFYYNPNITKEEEYKKRVEEVKRLVSEMNVKNEVTVVEGEYNPNVFFEMAKGLEGEPEGGRRCYECYKMRLKETAIVAKEKNYDYFTTTLSISPHKNATWINELGQEMEQTYGSHFLPSDFKKKNGFKRSIELSQQYKLYRQDFCGCVFSRREQKNEG